MVDTSNKDANIIYSKGSDVMNQNELKSVPTWAVILVAVGMIAASVVYAYTTDPTTIADVIK